MPEDAIARAIAEQASRSPQDLGAVVPGVVVGFGETGLAVAAAVQRLLSGSAAARTSRAALRHVVLAPAGSGAPADEQVAVVGLAPEWRPDRVRLRHVDEWLSPELARTQPETLRIRQVERLAYFSVHSAIRERLQVARDTALAAVPDPAALTFYLVARLGEGGGSGCVFDLAHLAWQLLADWPDGRVVGYLLLPGADAPPLARAGAFAALKELDYFNAGGELAVRYAAGAPAETLASPLFSACYLLDAPRPGGSRQGDPAASDVVALHIHADFLTGGVGYANRAVRERLGRFARAGKEDREGCQTAYRALGATRLHIDGDRLARACGLAVAERLLARVLEAGQDDAGARLSRFVTPWSPGDHGSSLMRRLGSADAQRQFADLAGEAVRDLAARIDREADPARVRVWLEARIDEQVAALQPCGDGIWPAVLVNVAAAGEAFAADLDRELSDIGSAVRTGAWFGPAERFLAAYAARLRLHFEQATDGLEQEARIAESCEQMLAGHLDEVMRAYAHPLAKFGASRKVVTERPLAALWRTLEELLAVRARMAIWSAVPAFLEAAGLAVERRAGALALAATQVAEARKRVLAAHQQVLGDAAAPGELFHPAWLEADVNAVLSASAEDLLGRLAGSLLERCGVASPVDLAAAGPAEDLGVRLAAALREVADEAAALARPHTAADRFSALAPTELEQRQALMAALQAAAPRLDLAPRAGAELPGPEATTLLVGIPGGPANPHGEFASILDLLLLCVDEIQIGARIGIADLAGRADQILLLREVAGFPLRCVAAIDDLAGRYREWTRQPKAEPVHIAKDPGAFETIPGIFPPDERTKRRALEAFVVGVQWGVFEIENGIVLHRQKLPGMTFLDTRIIGTLDRPLRAVKYLVDHPDLVQFAHGRIEELLAEAQADPAVRQDRLGRLERYYLRILEECRGAVIAADLGLGDDEAAQEEVIRHLPLWELAEAILAFNSRHALTAAGPDALPEAESGALPGEESAALPGARSAMVPGGGSGDPSPAGPTLLPPSSGSDDVQCRRCGALSPARAKFCGECAAPFGRPDACPACGAQAPAGARYCIECATPLGDARWEPSRPLP
ncbi:MAG: zinc ribbon domain-containing protein [Candidatus Sericytochromatia bacterium]|nr:zinc ribbon domain-containing protein [Candidatus Tanganyikabacteria bacterium]